MLFSGDMTDAPKPNGASELFFMKKGLKTTALMMLNYYNFSDGEEVEFKILLSKEKLPCKSNIRGYFSSNFMVNPNSMIATCSSKISVKQKCLGLLVSDTKECRFYYLEAELGKTNSVRNNKYIHHTQNYLIDSNKNLTTMREILELAGAKIVTEGKFDIDLSNESVTKDSLIGLLTK
jgi:hypothetical protein